MTSKAFTAILSTFGFYVNLAHILHVSPYRFDVIAQKLVFDARLRYKLGFYLHILLLLSYDAFLAIQSLRALKDSSAFDSYSELRLFHYARIFGVLSPSVVPAIAQFGTHAPVVNALLAIKKDLQEKHRLKIGSKGTKWIFRVFVAFAIGCPTVFSRGVVRNPLRPHLVSSLFPGLGIFAKLPFMALQSLVFFTALFNVAFAVLILLLFLEVTLPAVQLLRVKGQFGNPRSIRAVFGLLSVLERIFASVLGPWTLLIVAVAIVAITFSLLQGLIFGEWVTSALAVVVLALLTPFTQTCAALYESCRGVLETWKVLRRSDGAFARWRKGCKPLRVNIGSFFYFDRAVMLTFLDIIVSQAVSIMLYYR